jgi:thiol-disulfide isomerase/thioredoxin
MPAGVEVNSVDAFQTAALQHQQTVVFFWAHWSEPCEALNEVIEDVASSHPTLQFLRVSHASWSANYQFHKRARAERDIVQHGASDARRQGNS